VTDEVWGRPIAKQEWDAVLVEVPELIEPPGSDQRRDGKALEAAKAREEEDTRITVFVSPYMWSECMEWYAAKLHAKEEIDIRHRNRQGKVFLTMNIRLVRDFLRDIETWAEDFTNNAVKIEGRRDRMYEARLRKSYYSAADSLRRQLARAKV
jgi:hypothetical protein